jgi:hypothetical protein
MTPEEWMREQLKPLSMFEIAKWWADGLKVCGAGNGAGVLAVGAALTSSRLPHASVICAKIAGASFFIGVIAFALAFLLIYNAMHAQDEVAQGTLYKDVDRISKNSAISGSAMNLANKLAMVSTAAFFFGCIVGLIAFVLI